MKNWKNLVALLLVVVMCTGLFIACGKKPAAQEAFTLTLGFDAGFPPYGYKDGDDYVGFDIDLAKEVCKRQGWTLELRPIDWNAKDMELTSGAIDCIWNGFTINGRENLYTWTVPYVDNSQVVMVSTASGITSLSDLAGKVVAVQDDSSAHHALTDPEGDEELIALKDSFSELRLAPDYTVAFMDLQSGMVDAVALDVGVAKFQLENRSGEFIILDDILVKEQYGVGFLLGNTELKDKVEASLMDMSKDGSFLKIAEQWDLQDSVVLGK